MWEKWCPRKSLTSRYAAEKEAKLLPVQRSQDDPSDISNLCASIQMGVLRSINYYSFHNVFIFLFLIKFLIYSRVQEFMPRLY